MTSSVQDSAPTLADVIRTSQALSAGDRLLLAKALLDSLISDKRGTVGADEPVDVQEVDEEATVARERAAFVALHPTLLEQYPGEFVAIHNGQVVDHDVEGLALSRRIYQSYSTEFVWIAPVTEQAMEEWVVRSPRFDAVAT
ncbi:MAG: hypothetical protein R2932_43565 [Caldilineaceae bacterium]